MKLLYMFFCYYRFIVITEMNIFIFPNFSVLDCRANEFEKENFRYVVSFFFVPSLNCVLHIILSRFKYKYSNDQFKQRNKKYLN